MPPIMSKPETFSPKVEQLDSKISLPNVDITGNQDTNTDEDNDEISNPLDSSNSDDKGEEPDTKTKYINFLKSLAKLLIFILLSVILGASVLYSCKVATSNILPTDMNCSPYTKNDPDVMPIDLDINIIKNSEKIFSTKINFPFNAADDEKINEIAEYNRSNFILDWIRNQKEVYNSWAIKMMFLSILESLFQKNYSLTSSILHFMDKSFYELIIVFLGPLLLFFASGILSLITLFYSIYLFFTEFHWIFKENTNKERGKKPVWSDVTFSNLYSYGVSCFIAFLMVIFFIISYVFMFPLVSLGMSVFFVVCLFSATYMKSLISDGPKIGETYGIKKVFVDVLTSKMKYIMVIVSLAFISLSYSHFGSVSATFAIIIFGLLFFGLIGNKLYEQEMPVDVTEGLINESFEQAEKTCTEIFSGGFSNKEMFQSGGEANLLKKLKSLSNILKH
jgi:hypothetical protein